MTHTRTRAPTHAHEPFTATQCASDFVEQKNVIVSVGPPGKHLSSLYPSAAGFPSKFTCQTVLAFTHPACWRLRRALARRGRWQRYSRKSLRLLGRLWARGWSPVYSRGRLRCPGVGGAVCSGGAFGGCQTLSRYNPQKKKQKRIKRRLG